MDEETDRLSDVDPGRTDARPDRGGLVPFKKVAGKALARVRGNMKRARDLRDAGVGRITRKTERVK